MKFIGLLLVPTYLFSTELHFYICSGPEVNAHMAVTADPNIPIGRVQSYFFLNQGMNSNEWDVRFEGKNVDPCLSVNKYGKEDGDVALTVQSKGSTDTCIYHPQCDRR
jgi:hypothetical protein